MSNVTYTKYYKYTHTKRDEREKPCNNFESKRRLVKIKSGLLGVTYLNHFYQK